MHKAVFTPILFLLVQIMQAQPTFSLIAGGTEHDAAHGSVATPDNGSVICGTTHATSPGGFSDAYVMKLDATGTLLWQLVLGDSTRDDVFRKVIRTSTGDLVAIGETGSVSSTWPEIMIAKLTPTGSLLWCRRYPAASWGEGYDIVETATGNLLCTGALVSGMQVYLRVLEVDPGGTPVWSMNYDTPSDTQGATDVVRTSDGGYLLIGTVNVVPGSNAGFALKIDAAGAVGWYHRYFAPQPYTGLAAGYAGATDQQGYLLVGSFEDDGGTDDAQLLILSIDQFGVPVWARTVEHARAQDVLHLGIGGTEAVITGGTTAPDKSLLILGIDAAGNVTWSREVDGVPATSEEMAHTICRNTDGTLAVSGEFIQSVPLVDESFIVRAPDHGSADVCLPATPFLASTPVAITDSAAAPSASAFASTAVDPGFAPMTGISITSTFCQTAGIMEGALDDPSIALERNGAQLILISDGTSANDVVTVHDAIGRLELMRSFGHGRIDISKLGAGWHLIRITSADRTRRARFVKE